MNNKGRCDLVDRKVGHWRDKTREARAVSQGGREGRREGVRPGRRANM